MFICQHVQKQNQINIYDCADYIQKMFICCEYIIFVCIAISKSSTLVGFNDKVTKKLRFSLLIRSFVFDFRNSALANALATRGHNVTVASVDEDEKP